MHLLKLYIQWERRHLAADRTFPIALLLFLGLMLLSLYQGSRRVAALEASQATMAIEQAERLEDLRATVAAYPDTFTQGDVVPQALTPYEVGGKSAKQVLFKPLSPLALLSQGQSDLFAATYAVSLREADFTLLEAQDHLDNPVALATGAFDFAFVVGWLLPLLVILYAYDFLSGERERGTLSLLMAQPVSIMQVLWAKVLVRFSLLGGLLMTATWLSLQAFGVSWLLQGPALLLLSGMLLSYLLFWFLLCLLVNLLGLNSMANLAILFTTWLMLVLVIPTGVSLLSAYQHPAPSRLALVNDLRAATQQADNEGAQLLDAFYFDHPELAPKGTTRNMASYVYRNALKHQLIEAKATPQVEAYYDQLDRQVDQAAAWRFVSPALMLQAALDRMAGHATTDYLTFQREVDAARGAWRDFFQPKIFKDEAITRRDLQAMPTWQVQAPAPAADRWWDLLGLLGFVAGLAALAWRARASGIDPRGLG